MPSNCFPLPLRATPTAGVEQNIVYKKELTAGDVIAVYSKVLEVRDRVIRIQHDMKKPDTGEAVWAYQVGDGRFEEEGHLMIADALEGVRIEELAIAQNLAPSS